MPATRCRCRRFMGGHRDRGCDGTEPRWGTDHPPPTDTTMARSMLLALAVIVMIPRGRLGGFLKDHAAPICYGFTTRTLPWTSYKRVPWAHLRTNQGRMISAAWHNTPKRLPFRDSAVIRTRAHPGYGRPRARSAPLPRPSRPPGRPPSRGRQPNLDQLVQLLARDALGDCDDLVGRRTDGWSLEHSKPC